MKEKILIDGKEVWILIEPHEQQEVKQDAAQEYFTASYTSTDPTAAAVSGSILFIEEDKSPRRFSSPVEALEYANEKLLGIV